jgi:hypothetical protein
VEAEAAFLRWCRAVLKSENFGNGVGLLHLSAARQRSGECGEFRRSCKGKKRGTECAAFWPALFGAGACGHGFTQAQSEIA